MFKQVVLTGALVVGSAGGAFAQAPTSWSGLYAGVYGGWGAGKSDVSTTQEGSGYFSAISTEAINGAGTFQLKSKGPLFGAQIGLNRQSGSAIFGVEADFGVSMVGSDAEDGRVTADYPCCAGKSFTIEHSLDTDWLITLRPRVGVAAGPVLVYGTGGLAIAKADFSSLFTDTLASARAEASLSERRAGWTLGAGLEGRMGETGTYRVEYLFADFGDMAVSTDSLHVGGIPVPREVFRYTADLKMHTVRAGVNYLF